MQVVLFIVVALIVFYVYKRLRHALSVDTSHIKSQVKADKACVREHAASSVSSVRNQSATFLGRLADKLQETPEEQRELPERT